MEPWRTLLQQPMARATGALSDDGHALGIAAKGVDVLLVEGGRLAMRSSNIGALIIRRGFWGRFY